MPRLEGRKLLLTRDVDDAADWAEAFAAEGALPFVLPCIATAPIDDPALLVGLAGAMSHADWLVFTSRRGVDACAALIGGRLPAGIRIAAVGRATAEHVRARFRPPELVGPSTAGELGAELAARADIEGASCVLALAANAGPALEQALTAAGANVERFDVYRTRPMAPIEPKHALSSLDCHAVIFASPTAVLGFANQVDVDMAPLFVTIGPSTSAAVRERRWDVAAEAREPSLSGIIESVMETVHV